MEECQGTSAHHAAKRDPHCFKCSHVSMARKLEKKQQTKQNIETNNKLVLAQTKKVRINTHSLHNSVHPFYPYRGSEVIKKYHFAV